MKIASRWVAVAALVGCAGFAQAGPDWVEGELRAGLGEPDGGTGGADAGSFLQTAQTTTGAGQLNSLLGRLGGGGALLDDHIDLEDMYKIRVDSPGTFSVTVVSGEGFMGNVALYLFRVDGDNAFGLLGAEGGFLGSTSTDGTEIELTQPGIYALAVTFVGRTPISEGGQIFDPLDAPPPEAFSSVITSVAGVSGPDGPGGGGPLDSWIGTPPPAGQLGEYLLTFTGASLVPGVGPLSGALAMLGMGAIATGRRRRI